jgi:5,10-methylenetetrahydrofolate reductase
MTTHNPMPGGMLMRLEKKLAANDFVVLAEMDPPKGTDVSAMVENALRVKGKVDAYVVPEMGNAVMRMSALGASLILQSRGMQTVMQVCCRDRNRLALQADLLAAGAFGIESIMAVQGEAPSYGDHHQARSVYDLDLMALFETVRTLQSGKDMAGVDLAGSPRFLMGAVADPMGDDAGLDPVIKDMQRKIAAGVRFFILPPIFDLKALDEFLTAARGLEAGIIPTVLLLKSLGMARYIARHMPGAHLPAGLIKRLQGAPDKVQECLKIAAEAVAQIRQEGFSGVMLSTMGWEDKIPEVLGR